MTEALFRKSYSMNLKQLSVLLLLLITYSFLSAQKRNTSKKNGSTFSSFGENQVMHFTSLEGDASYDSEKFYTLGVTYLHTISNCLDIEKGVEYSKHTITKDLNLHLSGFLAYTHYNRYKVLARKRQILHFDKLNVPRYSRFCQLIIEWDIY